MVRVAPELTRPPKTLADLQALPDETPAELICGELYVTPSPSEPHQAVSLRLSSLLLAYEKSSGRGRAYAAPFDVHLPSGDVVQPDALFVRSANPGLAKDGVHGAPDLVVEIVSPSHPLHDRVVKRDLYGRNGVPEYWIVDPEERSVEVLKLEGRTYAPAGYGTGQVELRSPTLDDLVIRLADLFP